MNDNYVQQMIARRGQQKSVSARQSTYLANTVKRKGSGPFADVKPLHTGFFKTCQFIEGTPSFDDSCKCGKLSIEGSSYCKKHHELTHQQKEKLQ